MEGDALGLVIRHFSWPDIEGICRVHRASEPVDHAGRLVDAALLRERWRRPGSNPERDCLVAEAGGAVLGYSVRTLVPGTDQCLVDGVVHPSWRRLGIGRRLVRRLAEEARQSGVSTLDIRARDDERATVAFSQALGFELMRVWHRMWLEPLRVAPFAFPSGYSWRYFRPHRDEEVYVEVVNNTMGEHWGVGPIGREEINYLVSQPSFEPADILFATRNGSSGMAEIAGVSAVRFLERQVGSRWFSVGHIGPVGVRAEHRGLGLAHALVANNLRQCRRRQIQAAELDVDEENAPAIHVYQDCGFELLFRILWYRLDLAAMEGQPASSPATAVRSGEQR